MVAVNVHKIDDSGKRAKLEDINEVSNTSANRSGLQLYTKASILPQLDDRLPFLPILPCIDNFAYSKKDKKKEAHSLHSCQWHSK